MEGPNQVDLMDQDNKNPKKLVAPRLGHAILICLLFVLLYFVDIKLFLMFLGLYVIVFILANVGVAVVDKKGPKDSESEDPDDVAVRIYSAHHSFGPRTDTKNMSRGELFQSGLQFLLLSTLPFFTIVGVAIVNASFEVIPEPAAMVIFFASTIFLFMCLLGGGYLLLLSLFRGPEKSGEDENESVETSL